MTDPGLSRWRLILGKPANEPLEGAGGALSDDDLARDAAMDWLYGRDDGQPDRDVRGAGDEDSRLSTIDWLDDIHRLFPKKTIDRLERDAVETYEITEIVTNEDVLARVEPSEALLKAVLHTKHLMNPKVLAMARRLIAKVVEELMAKLATEIRQSFQGARSRKRTNLRQARNFDFKRTIRENLKHYDADSGKIIVQDPFFAGRTRREMDRWQVIIVVDQSGSMTGSVMHAAVTAACLWGLPGIKTHLVAFDTNVVDLTSDVDDPVELLMKVQLGGGTFIDKAVDYAGGLIENPRRTIVALITDFYEGGSEAHLIKTVESICQQGTTFLGLAALDHEANPMFDRQLAQKLANVGANIGAMTPGELASFIAETVNS